MWMYYKWFMHSPVDEHLSCFHSSAIMNEVDMSIHAQAFWWASVLFSLGWIPRSGMAGTWVTLYKKFPNCFPQCLHHLACPLAVYVSSGTWCHLSFSFYPSCWLCSGILCFPDYSEASPSPCAYGWSHVTVGEEPIQIFCLSFHPSLFVILILSL